MRSEKKNSDNVDTTPQNVNFSSSVNLQDNKQILLLSINVCGLKSKLLCPEFTSFISQYDIIGLQESKLDDVDKINIPGYQVYSNNRKAVSRYRSGGITLLVKNDLSPFITVHKFESQLILWFSVSNKLTANSEELHCGIVYIPPYRSKYAHNDPYLELQTEFDKYAAKSRNILLFGDFNSRTSHSPDYIICDKFISENQGNDDLYRENVEILDCFDRYNIPLERNSVDLTINFYGQQLLELCKYNNIFKLNGRFGKAFHTPSPTCKDRSTIDYFISAQQNFPFIQSFEVLEFNSLFSDAHCPVTVSIEIRPTPTAKKTNGPTENSNKHVRLWDDQKCHLFA